MADGIEKDNLESDTAMYFRRKLVTLQILVVAGV